MRTTKLTQLEGVLQRTSNIHVLHVLLLLKENLLIFVMTEKNYYVYSDLCFHVQQQNQLPGYILCI